MVTRRQAALGLLAITFLWGGTFVWMKQALNALGPEVGEFSRTGVVGTMVAARFFIALVLLGILSQKARGGLTSKENWIGGLILGSLMLAGFVLQMIGIDSVNPSVSAFLTSLYVVFTALLSTWMSERRPTRVMILGVLLATFGAGFIDGPPHIVWGLAEILTVLCALFFALHIIYTDKITKRLDPISVTMTSFAVVVAGATLIGLVSARDVSVVSVVWQEGVILPLLCLGIFGSLVCILALNAFQRHLNPTHAAIIYAFEPVWATLYGLAEGLVDISIWLGIGGGALLIGNMIVELDESGNNYLNEDAGPE
ncbi:MAG: DMT family transporter [Candidatus Poseidoniaceae archaeon]|nr:DMT family transporter [Candidatus Poseidoniaceae archaeon]